MISLQHFRHRQHRAPLAWWLACVLLAQGLFPIQAHTAWGLGAAGELVQICTLNGTRTLVLPAPGDDPSTADLTDARNAACTFSQLLADAVSALPVLQPGWRELAVALFEPAPIPTVTARSFAQFSIRAPPAQV